MRTDIGSRLPDCRPPRGEAGALCVVVAQLRARPGDAVGRDRDAGGACCSPARRTPASAGGGGASAPPLASAATAPPCRARGARPSVMSFMRAESTSSAPRSRRRPERARGRGLTVRRAASQEEGEAGARAWTFFIHSFHCSFICVNAKANCTQWAPPLASPLSRRAPKTNCRGSSISLDNCSPGRGAVSLHGGGVRAVPGGSTRSMKATERLVPAPRRPTPRPAPRPGRQVARTHAPPVVHESTGTPPEKHLLGPWRRTTRG